jgi:signal transduction histidine kinase
MVVTKGTRKQGRGVARMSHRTAARLAWSLCAVCVAFIGLALLLDFLTDTSVVQAGFFQTAYEDRGLVPGNADPRLYALTGVLSLAYPMVGALIASRLPTNPIGWILCGVGVLYTGQRFTISYADHALLENPAFPGGEVMAGISNMAEFSGTVLAGVFLMLLFPDGRLLSRRWRIVAWMAVFGAVLTTVYYGFYPGPLMTHTYVQNPFGFEGVDGPLGWRRAYIVGGVTTEPFMALGPVGHTLIFTSSVAALFSLFLRLHRAEGVERQQLNSFLYAALPAVAFWAFVYDAFRWVYYPYLTFTKAFIPGGDAFVERFTDQVYYLPLFSLLFVPLLTYIAIVRYRLYDIDVVINRTLVYGSLSACVVGIYVLVVVALGTIFQARGNLAISLMATGFVAVLFQPLRMRLQRSVNRLMYGERDDPYAVISRLGRRLEATIAPESVLPTVVETIAQALKLPYAAILLKEGEGFRSAAAYGSPTTEPEALPLVYQREEIGRLVIAPRAPGEAFSDADRNLLEDLARQAEVAVHAVRLTSDLQRSRERLVATREEERRRLRRDLHDGFGPTLASLGLGLNVARKLMASNELQDADGVLAHLEQETEETVADVRRLIYGLRPPALDDLGLVAAIQQQAESQGMVGTPIDTKINEHCEEQPVFTMEAPEKLPPLPAALEVAAYRIAQEAITNVARYAKARTCRVRLSIDEAADTVQLEVRDDGVGMAEGRRAGVGLSSMRERAEELGGTCNVKTDPGGGTRVLARLPLPTSEKRPEGASSSWRAPYASS